MAAPGTCRPLSSIRERWRRRRDSRPARRHADSRTVNAPSPAGGVATPATPGSRDDAAATYRLWALGAAAAALTLATPFAFRLGGDNYYMAMTIPAGLVALAATSVAERAPTKQALWFI